MTELRSCTWMILYNEWALALWLNSLELEWNFTFVPHMHFLICLRLTFLYVVQIVEWSLELYWSSGFCSSFVNFFKYTFYKIFKRESSKLAWSQVYLETFVRQSSELFWSSANSSSFISFFKYTFVKFSRDRAWNSHGARLTLS